MKYSIFTMIFLTMLLLVTSLSCKKEKFPRTKNLQGVWIEDKTNQNFKHKLVFENETMYFHKPKSIDTFIYSLNKKEELITLKLKNYPDLGESKHTIKLNKREQELTIWDFVSIITIGVKPSKATFKKEKY